jgi:hypothetical protein
VTLGDGGFMRRLLRQITAVFLLLALMALDPLLKVGLGALVVVLLWLPFGLFGGQPFRAAYAWVGLGLGFVLVGLWDCCDVFGLNRFGEWAHKQFERPGANDEAPQQAG